MSNTALLAVSPPPRLHARWLACFCALAALALAEEARAACDPGSYPCGADYCADEGLSCCAGVGRPDISCSPGSVCTYDGCQTEGGGGSCSAGEASCGGGCMPYGSDCCGAAGYCSAGTYCSADGTSCSGGGPSSPGGGDYGGDYESCTSAPISAEGCDSIEACCDLSSCLYRTDDGTVFECAGHECSSAAQEVVDHCEDRGWGCSSAPGASGRPLGFGALLVLAAALLRLRRSRNA